DLDVVVLHRTLGAEAVLDLVGERDLEGILLDGGPVLALRRLERGERALVPACCRAGEGGGAFCGRARGLRAQAVVAGEAPGAVHQHAHADSIALEIVQPVDALVPRRDGLAAAHDDASVRVRSTGSERRGHRLVAELPHPKKTNRAATMLGARWWRNW